MTQAGTKLAALGTLAVRVSGLYPICQVGLCGRRGGGSTTWFTRATWRSFMSTCHKRVIWLSREGADRGADALLVSGLCGDDIQAPGGAWMRPGGVSRGEGIILLGYEGAGGGLAFCAVAPPDLSPEWVQSLRTELGPEGAERRWGPFVGQFGRYRSVVSSAAPAAAWLETTIVHDGVMWGARRARHPSVAIDCLSRRDRCDAEQRLREVLAQKPASARRESAVAAQRGGSP